MAEHLAQSPSQSSAHVYNCNYNSSKAQHTALLSTNQPTNSPTITITHPGTVGESRGPRRHRRLQVCIHVAGAGPCPKGLPQVRCDRSGYLLRMVLEVKVPPEDGLWGQRTSSGWSWTLKEGLQPKEFEARSESARNLRLLILDICGTCLGPIALVQ